MRFIPIILFWALTFNCTKYNKIESRNTKSIDTLVSNFSQKTLEINLDSIYPKKKYEFTLKQIDKSAPYSLDENDKNYLFLFRIEDKVLLIDSVYSVLGLLKFEDFNGDKVKDVLIQNNSDVRSNWTYNLYIADTLNNKLEKIKGFNEIKNPKYLPKYNLIDNEVMSGREWTSFYQIQTDTIFDFGFVIYKGMNADGSIVDFEKEYKETLSQVLKNKNYR